MDLAIIGWVWLGIIIGVLAGVTVSAFGASAKIGDLEREIFHHIAIRDALKEEIFRLENQSKPQPRKKRNLKVKSLKVGD